MYVFVLNFKNGFTLNVQERDGKVERKTQMQTLRVNILLLCKVVFLLTAASA